MTGKNCLWWNEFEPQSHEEKQILNREGAKSAKKRWKAETAERIWAYLIEKWSEGVPAIDYCEPQVIRAFIKSDWEVLDKPYLLRVYGEKGVFADLRLKKRNNSEQIVIVEVKCFPKTRSQLDEFYHALGQYLFYRTAMKSRGTEVPLYLVVPTHAYSRVFRRRIVQTIIRDFDIKLVVVDIDKEELLQWRH